MYSVSWNDLKIFVDSRHLSIQFLELTDTYLLSAFDGPFELRCQINKTDPKSAKQVDFEDNYKTDGNKRLTSKDFETEGIRFTPKYTKTGWKQQVFEIEFETSTLNSIHEKDINNQNIGWSSVKFYKFDDQGNEIEMLDPTQIELENNCIRTDFLWMPNIDYMILSGQIAQIVSPNNDIYVWTIGVDLDLEYGGPQFTFAEGGINLDYISSRSAVGMKGVAGTILYYDKVVDSEGNIIPLPPGSGSNRLRFVTRHPIGFKHRLQPIFVIFRE